MTFGSRNLALAHLSLPRDLFRPANHFFAIALVLLGAAAPFGTSLGAEEASEESSAAQVFELPPGAGSGQGKEVSVLLDESHLKLVTLALRQGTILPSHSAPVPTTIQVLEGEGLMHLGSQIVSVSQGTLVSLAAGEAHDVVPTPGSDMLLLVHYLRGGEGAPAAPAHDH